MATVFNIGQMELIMRDNGISIKQKDKELFGMLKEIFIEANSKTIWPMGMENIRISMEVGIKGNLEMMYKKDMEKKSGSMEPSM